jgi:hypothetical protein
MHFSQTSIASVNARDFTSTSTIMIVASVLDGSLSKTASQ